MGENINEAIITLLCDNNLFCSSYPSKILVGHLKSCKFVTQETFVFFKSDFTTLYHSILEIVSSIPFKTRNKSIILRRDDLIYYYDVTFFDDVPRVALFIEFQNNLQLKTVFELESWNDFLNVISELLLPTLCLNEKLYEIINCVLEQESIETVLQFGETSECLKYLKSSKYPKVPSTDLVTFSKCLKYYREIIIILIKLKSLYNPQITSEKIQKLFPVTNHV